MNEWCELNKKDALKGMEWQKDGSTYLDAEEKIGLEAGDLLGALLHNALLNEGLSHSVNVKRITG
jgi:hypothetical protein